MQTANISNNNDISNNKQKGKGLLTHPIKRTALIIRILKSARNSCASLLHDLQKILSQSNNIAFWQEFLHFGPTILAKPNICGKRRNLSNIILKFTSDWSENQEPEEPKEAKAVIPRPHKPPLNNDVYEKKQALLITSKLELSNFKDAVKFICSDDMPAMHNQQIRNVQNRLILIHFKLRVLPRAKL